MQLVKHFVFLLLTSFPLFALEVTLGSGKENFEKFSILHLRDASPFVCQEIHDDMQRVVQIVCAFSKQPSRAFAPLQNDFFSITQEVKNEIFFLKIRPFEKMKLYPIHFDLDKEESVFSVEDALATHWIALGYKENIPFIKEEQKSDTAIRFPYTNPNEMLPYVGGLDIQGNPVYVDKIQDVSDYIRIKKYFNNKQYESCLQLTEEVMQKFPDSLFTNEFMFYQIKGYFWLHAYDRVIDISKNYLKEYSSDENVPEVLALVAKAYALSGLHVDADYFFDRLFSEHADSEFSNLGYVYKGEMLESSGASSKALEFYEKALNATQNIDIAVLAAYKLAFYKITYSNTKEAAEYIDKILGAKSSFFAEDLEHSLNTMYLFVEEGDYATAAAIAKALLESLDRSNEIYEELLSQRALWLAKTPKKEEALGELNCYLSFYPYGLYSDAIQVAKDGLFFSQGDQNLSAQIERYDYLMRTYANDTIGDKAIYEKAKLFLNHGMYGDVLDMRGMLEALDVTLYADAGEIIHKGAVGAMEKALEQKECKQVLVISSEYNVTLSSKWDDGIYECAMKGGDYRLAKQITTKHLDAKAIQERKKWLYRHIDVDFMTGNYTDVVDASGDLIQLIEGEKDSEYKNIYRILFDTYRRVENKEQMLRTIAVVEKHFGNTYEDLDRYAAVMYIGIQLQDTNIVLTYGKRVFEIQQAARAYPQTPFVEFTLFQAYMQKEDFQNALEVIRSLDSYENLSNEQRSRQKYLLGTAHAKLWQDAKAQEAYDAAIKADGDSAWAKLAQSAKEL